MQDQKNILKKRFHLRRVGEGKKLLFFIHGFASNQKSWQWIEEDLKKDYQLLFMDLAGAGESDPQYYTPERYDSLNGYVEDVLEVLSAYELQEVILIGHSVGGLIALLAGDKARHCVQQVFMIGTSPRYLNDQEYFGGFTEEEVYQVLHLMEENFLGWASYTSKIALPPELSASGHDHVEKSFAKSRSQVTHQFLKLTLLMDHRALLKEVQVPTVILQCAKDSFVPLAAAKYLEAQIHGSILHILSAKGHYPQVSHPEETIEAIRRHIKE